MELEKGANYTSMDSDFETISEPGEWRYDPEYPGLGDTDPKRRNSVSSSKVSSGGGASEPVRGRQQTTVNGAGARATHPSQPGNTGDGGASSQGAATDTPGSEIEEIAADFDILQLSNLGSYPSQAAGGASIDNIILPETDMFNVGDGAPYYDKYGVPFGSWGQQLTWAGDDGIPPHRQEFTSSPQSQEDDRDDGQSETSMERVLNWIDLLQVEEGQAHEEMVQHQGGGPYQRDMGPNVQAAQHPAVQMEGNHLSNMEHPPQAPTASAAAAQISGPTFFNVGPTQQDVGATQSRASRATQKRKDRRRARRRVRFSADQDTAAARAGVCAHVPAKRQREGTPRPPNRRENSPKRTKSYHNDQPVEDKPQRHPDHKKGYYTSKFGPNRRHL